MIKITRDEEGLVLIYEEEDRSTQWIERELADHGEVTLIKVFTFATDDRLEPPVDEFDFSDDKYHFRLATIDGDYYRVPGRVLGTPRDVLLVAQGLRIDRGTFAAHRGISIFRRIADAVGGDVEIVIGGSQPDAVSAADFDELLRKFPKTTELNLYARARIATIVGDYFDGMADHRARYEEYLSKRSSMRATDLPSMDALLLSEVAKYEYVRDTIVSWLSSGTVRSEKDWQRMVIDFILLIFPKYVAVLQNVHIEDRYSRPGKVTPRYIDIALVDANGHIDVIEIKRPFDDLLLAKTIYRGNNVPAHELSGTIMQAEKYLFHLSKWGVDGEKRIQAKHGATLPSGMEIRITNPRAMLILGRDKKPDGSEALSAGQSFDLEIIKRKYAKMMDIITYDDLLRRLDRVIESLRRRLGGGGTGGAAAGPSTIEGEDPLDVGEDVVPPSGAGAVDLG